MRLLAIDPGTSCGWAISYHGLASAAPGFSGVWDLKPRRGESGGVRYVRLRGHLQRLYVAFPDIDLVGYEQPHHRGGAATEIAGGIVGMIQAFAVDHGVEYVAVHSGTVKRHATGKGNANKPLMLGAARAKWGRDIESDDQADALWLLDYMLCEYGN